MSKRLPKCDNCGEKMTLIEGTEHSYVCGSCGTKKISSLDKEYMKEYIEHQKKFSTFSPER